MTAAIPPRRPGRSTSRHLRRPRRRRPLAVGASACTGLLALCTIGRRATSDWRPSRGTSPVSPRRPVTRIGSSPFGCSAKKDQSGIRTVTNARCERLPGGGTAHEEAPRRLRGVSARAPRRKVPGDAVVVVHHSPGRPTTDRPFSTCDCRWEWRGRRRCRRSGRRARSSLPAGDEAETGVVEVAVHLDRGEPVLGVDGGAIGGDSRCAVPDDVSRDHRGAEGPGVGPGVYQPALSGSRGVSIALSLPSARSSSLEATLIAGIEMLGGREADSTVVPGSPPGQPDALPSGEAVCPIVARDVPACPSQWEGRGAGGRFPGPASVRRHSQEDLGVGSAAIRRDAGCLRWASGSRTVSSRGGVQKSPAVACARMALGAERMTSQGIPTHLRDADFWSIWCSRSRITLGPPRRSESWLCRGRRLCGGVCVRVGPGRGRIRGCST